MLATTNLTQSYSLEIYTGTATKRNGIFFRSIQFFDNTGTQTIVTNHGGGTLIGVTGTLTNVRFLFGSGNISTATWSLYGIS